MSTKKPIALVTGASRGMGRAFTKKLVENGYDVYGTSRKPEGLLENEKIPGVTYLQLDLTDEKSISTLISKFSDISLLINNAGMSQVGVIEETPMDSVRHLFELNLFGQIQLIKGFIPVMRKKEEGIIINITSMAGKSPVPFSPIYAATKSAYNAFTQGIRHELGLFNIKVVAVAPFQVDTTIPQKKDYGEAEAYQEILKRAKTARDSQLAHSVSPEYVAEQVWKIINKKNPGPFYPVGEKAWLLAFLIKHMPAKMVENSMKKRFKL